MTTYRLHFYHADHLTVTLYETRPNRPNETTNRDTHVLTIYRSQDLSDDAFNARCLAVCAMVALANLSAATQR